MIGKLRQQHGDATVLQARHRQLVASGQLNLGDRQWIENLLPTHTADFGPDLEFFDESGY